MSTTENVQAIDTGVLLAQSRVTARVEALKDAILVAVSCSQDVSPLTGKSAQVPKLAIERDEETVSLPNNSTNRNALRAEIVRALIGCTEEFQASTLRDIALGILQESFLASRSTGEKAEKQVGNANFLSRVCGNSEEFGVSRTYTELENISNMVLPF